MTDGVLSERRAHVIDRLSTQYAQGAFEVDELERRLALVHGAQSTRELDALVTEVAPAVTALVPAQHMRIVMGSIERVGPWTVPQDLAVRVICGSVVLDLRDARLAPGITTIEVNITMGNVEVILPPGVGVDVETTSFLGNIEERTEPSMTRASSSVRVVGRIKLGNLELATMDHGETHREAWWRRRSERRWRRRERRQRHALPWE